MYAARISGAAYTYTRLSEPIATATRAMCVTRRPIKPNVYGRTATPAPCITPNPLPRITLTCGSESSILPPRITRGSGAALQRFGQKKV